MISLKAVLFCYFETFLMAICNLDMLRCNLAPKLLYQGSAFGKVCISDANTTKKELTNYENNDTYKKQKQIFPGT